MAKMYKLVMTTRINGRVFKSETLGYGDAENTRKDAARVINTTLSGYEIVEKGNRIIATLKVEKQAIKVFLAAVDMEAGKKFAVRKSIHKNGTEVDRVVVFEGSQDECADFVKAELERYKGLDVVDMFTTEKGSGHVEYVTKKGSNFKVNFIVKAAA